MWCLASNCKLKFYQVTFLAVFNLHWTLVIRNSKEMGILFDILGITLSVQNLACIKFGVYKIWGLAIERFTEFGVDLFWRIVKRHHFSKLRFLRVNIK